LVTFAPKIIKIDSQFVKSYGEANYLKLVTFLIHCIYSVKAIFGKVDGIATEQAVIQLTKGKYLPIMFYIWNTSHQTITIQSRWVFLLIQKSINR